MSRPQGAQAGSAGNIVDATLCAHSGTTIERRLTAADFPRLRAAGVREGSAFTVLFRFSQFEGRTAIDGELQGSVVLTCQRCMKPFEWPLQERFQVILVRTEAELEQEPGGYEAIVADPARLDLQALAEDQGLLALPLVPKHESETCDAVVSTETQATGEVQTTQRPFGNLRDLLGSR